METNQHVLIVGAGVFGLTAAIVLGEAGIRVTVIEKENDIMQGASLVNQNRIHFGYHYPRSKSTCLESLAGFRSFKDFYGGAIYDGFKKYYAIAKEGSYMDASQFYQFCEDLGLVLKDAWPGTEILDRERVEACWLTDEPVFDYNILKQIITYRTASNANITIKRNLCPLGVSEDSSGRKNVTLSDKSVVTCDAIVNATYAGISTMAVLLGKQPIPAKYQLCLMPILTARVPPQEMFGVTVMDGPFCSLMPRGVSGNQFIMYHVKHSVIETHVGDQNIAWSPIEGFPELQIIAHSKLYFPVLDSMQLCDSWITTRIVLPQQEIDDARPTFTVDHGGGIYSLFSGKLTTCVAAAYDLLTKVRH